MGALAHREIRGIGMRIMRPGIRNGIGEVHGHEYKSDTYTDRQDQNDHFPRTTQHDRKCSMVWGHQFEHDSRQIHMALLTLQRTSCSANYSKIQKHCGMKGEEAFELLPARIAQGPTRNLSKV